MNKNIWSPSTLCVALLAALCAALLWAPAAWSGDTWEEVTREGGIVISARQHPGQNLPTFRGQGVLRGNILEILAVLSDTNRNAEWMHQCVEARLLKEIDEGQRIIYNRTDAPWPVSDRDVVLKTSLEVDTARQTVVTRFWSISSPLKGPVADVVRMPSLKGFYRLKVIDKDRTHVTYQVDADPGGSLPDWLAESASRDLPLNTLRGLQRQVNKTRGQYKERVQAWSAKYKVGAASEPAKEK
jgi:hypothetical protein